jgi:hypothetical protein
MASLRKEARSLGINIKSLSHYDVDRVREAVFVVRHAHAYFPRDPLHNGVLAVTDDGRTQVQCAL